jgi:hypothetical protein
MLWFEHGRGRAETVLLRSDGAGQALEIVYDVFRPAEASTPGSFPDETLDQNRGSPYDGASEQRWPSRRSAGDGWRARPWSTVALFEAIP